MKLPEEIREFFRKQGSIGGKKRKANLSAEERHDIARRAAIARWSTEKQNEAASVKGQKSSGRKSK
jgi:hypothetical protein